MACLPVFLCLQLLDFLTTVIGLTLGAGEISPLTRLFMQLGPVAGVAIAKGFAFLLAGMCVWLRRRHVIRWINYYFAGLVVWNSAQILLALR